MPVRAPTPRSVPPATSTAVKPARFAKLKVWLLAWLVLSMVGGVAHKSGLSRPLEVAAQARLLTYEAGKIEAQARTQSNAGSHMVSTEVVRGEHAMTLRMNVALNATADQVDIESSQAMADKQLSTSYCGTALASPRWPQPVALELSAVDSQGVELFTARVAREDCSAG